MTKKKIRQGDTALFIQQPSTIMSAMKPIKGPPHIPSTQLKDFPSEVLRHILEFETDAALLSWRACSRQLQRLAEQILIEQRCTLARQLPYTWKRGRPTDSQTELMLAYTEDNDHDTGLTVDRPTWIRQTMREIRSSFSSLNLDAAYDVLLNEDRYRQEIGNASSAGAVLGLFEANVQHERLDHWPRLWTLLTESTNPQSQAYSESEQAQCTQLRRSILYMIWSSRRSFETLTTAVQSDNISSPPMAPQIASWDFQYTDTISFQHKKLIQLSFRANDHRFLRLTCKYERQFSHF